MNRWNLAALLLLPLLAFTVPARASEPTIVGGAAFQLEASRGSLYDIPYDSLELGAGIGFRRQDSPLTFHWLGVLGRGATQNGLTIWTVATNVSVDISFWKLHLEPTAGMGMITVNRITSSDTLFGFSWPVALYAGPSFDLDGSRLAIDLALRADIARNASGHGFGLRVRYELF
ncbi:MAG TPA: hypothetical protein VNG33_10790 [Polyangiaceae bacterium]|nr:hypothetical protein [Polyangiaceae bacterium]